MAICSRCGCEVGNWDIHRVFHDTLKINKKLEKTMLSGIRNHPDSIVSLVAGLFGLTENDIYESSYREQHYVEARYVIAYVLYNRFEFSYSKIGHVIQKHHVTVMNLLKKDRGCKTEIEKVYEILDELDKS